MDALDVLGMPPSPLLTVEEAAQVLRIGRSLAYQLAGEYRASSGVSGMPVIPIGGCLRVPRWALLELGPTAWVVFEQLLAHSNAPSSCEQSTTPSTNGNDGQPASRLRPTASPRSRTRSTPKPGATVRHVSHWPMRCRRLPILSQAWRRDPRPRR